MHAHGGGDGVPVPAGCMSLHHTHTPHCSAPNCGTGRRIGVGISYIPAHVKPLTQPVSSALLARGRDRYGYYHLEERLKHAASELARKAHIKAYRLYMAGLYMAATIEPAQ
ncbi:MAG: hypothetical protein GKR94_04840 [Gammaproteobacteria bacterium]|nr:hypothetical protein [Gammaproteobacteria bacterium]